MAGSGGEPPHAMLAAVDLQLAQAIWAAALHSRLAGGFPLRTPQSGSGSHRRAHFAGIAPLSLELGLCRHDLDGGVVGRAFAPTLRMSNYRADAAPAHETDGFGVEASALCVCRKGSP